MLWDDIIIWLLEAKREDILSYAKTLPDDFFEAQRFVTDSLYKALSRKAPEDLREMQSLSDPSLPAQQPMNYSLLSLLDYASDALPSATAGTPFHTWATRMLNAWDGMMYLVTAKEFIEGKLFVDSCVNTNLTGAAIESLTLQVGMLYEGMLNDFSVNNYEEHDDSNERIRSCADTLKAFNFFPPNTIEAYSMLELGEEKLEFFRHLTDACVYASSITKVGAQTVEGYWLFLRTRMEFDIVHRNQIKVTDDPVMHQFIEQLAAIMTTEYLLSGKLLATISSYFPPLSVTEKKQFKEIFRNLVLENTEFEVITEPLQLDSFMAALERNAFEGSKREFIELNRVRVLPENWEYAKKLLEVLAIVF